MSDPGHIWTNELSFAFTVRTAETAVQTAALASDSSLLEVPIDVQDHVQRAGRAVPDVQADSALAAHREDGVAAPRVAQREADDARGRQGLIGGEEREGPRGGGARH